MNNQDIEQDIGGFKMLSVDQRSELREMFALQLRLNVIIDGPDWISKNRDYLRAAAHESLELQGHVGWKWWKKQETNLTQAHIELVDIFHFMLSALLVAGRGDIDQALLTYDLSSRGDETTNVFPDTGRATSLLGRDLLERIDGFAGCCCFGVGYMFVFHAICSELGLNWATLRRMYVGKNVLNIFRQDMGYKTGAYSGTWGTIEDNVYLEEIMAANPDASADNIRDRLHLAYVSTMGGVQ